MVLTIHKYFSGPQNYNPGSKVGAKPDGRDLGGGGLRQDGDDPTARLCPAEAPGDDAGFLLRSLS